MIIKYTLNEEDYIQSNLDYIKFSDSFKKQVNLIRGTTAVILFLGASLILNSVVGVGLGLVLSVAEFVFFEKYYEFITRRKIKKAITKEDLSFYIKGVDFITTPYGFTIEGKGKKLRYKWTEVKIVGESKDRIYLFAENGISEIIPKRGQDEEILKCEIIDRVLKEGKAVHKLI
ncbi:MAG: YcxB family protein [Filifactoraceae bacterium]